jgi:mRNA interferase YafQ
LLEQQQLPPEFEAHKLSRRMSAYNEFHLRDTPKNRIVLKVIEKGQNDRSHL